MVGDYQFVGIDAIIEWLWLSGKAGKLLSRWLLSPHLYPVADLWYQWVAEHRHLI